MFRSPDGVHTIRVSAKNGCPAAQADIPAGASKHPRRKPKAPPPSTTGCDPDPGPRHRGGVSVLVGPTGDGPRDARAHRPVGTPENQVDGNTVGMVVGAARQWRASTDNHRTSRRH